MFLTDTLKVRCSLVGVEEGRGEYIGVGSLNSQLSRKPFLKEYVTWAYFGDCSSYVG